MTSPYTGRQKAAGDRRVEQNRFEEKIMRPKIVIIVFFSTVLSLLNFSAFATPIDLTGFSSNPAYDASHGGISTLTPGEVRFHEHLDDFGFASDVTFSNDSFLVENDMEILSFSYEFALGIDDYDDFFTFSFIEDYNDPKSPEIILLEADVNNSSGIVSFDLTPYQNQAVSLSWRLLWGWDGYWDADNNWISDITGSSAKIFNLDITRDSSSVPEPSTMFLMGSGLIGLSVLWRKKVKQL
jgi:hypothetical protein